MCERDWSWVSVSVCETVRGFPTIMRSQRAKFYFNENYIFASEEVSVHFARHTEPCEERCGPETIQKLMMSLPRETVDNSYIHVHVYVSNILKWGTSML